MKSKTIADTHLNEHNHMVFNDLSRHHEATSVCDLISLLVLGPRCCRQNDRITFENIEDFPGGLRRDTRMTWFTLNNAHSSATDETPKSHRKNVNWYHEKENG